MYIWHLTGITTDNVVRFLLAFVDSVLIPAWHWHHQSAPIVGHIALLIASFLEAGGLRILRIASFLGLWLLLRLIIPRLLSSWLWRLLISSSLIALIPFTISGWFVAVSVLLATVSLIFVVVSWLLIIILSVLVVARGFSLGWLIALLLTTLSSIWIRWLSFGFSSPVLLIAADRLGQIVSIRINISRLMTGRLVGSFPSQGRPIVRGAMVINFIIVGVEFLKRAKMVDTFVEIARFARLEKGYKVGLLKRGLRYS